MITTDQAKRTIQTGTAYVDVQRRRLDTEPDTVVCDSAAAFYKLLHEAEAGAVYRMWITVWPPNPDYVTAPWYTNPTEINNADLALVAQVFVETWGSNTGRGVYFRG